MSSGRITNLGEIKGCIYCLVKNGKWLISTCALRELRKVLNPTKQNVVQKLSYTFPCDIWILKDYLGICISLLHHDIFMCSGEET
jgi:hypothetical protein